MDIDITVRKVREDDILVLAEVYTSAFVSFYPDEPWTHETATKLLEYQFKINPVLSLVAVTESKLIGGFFSDIRPWWNGNHLVEGELFVEPEYQKHGVGTKLLKEMLTIAREKFSAVEWDFLTFRNAGFQKEWYESIGFKEHKELAFMTGNIEQALQKLDDE